MGGGALEIIEHFSFPFPSPSPAHFFSYHLLPRKIFPLPNPPQLPNVRWWPNKNMCTRAPKIRLHCRLELGWQMLNIKVPTITVDSVRRIPLNFLIAFQGRHVKPGLYFPPYVCRYIVPVDNTKFPSKFTEKHHFVWQLFVFETDLDVCPISFSSVLSRVSFVFMEWFVETT